MYLQAPQPPEKQVLSRARFDRYALVALQALRTCGATESMGSRIRLLRGGARFYCDESPGARVLVM